MKYDDVILGEGCEFSSNSLITQLNNNVVVVGGSGSGKSMSYSEVKFLKLKYSNLIAKFSKRKLINKYSPLFRSRGYNVEVLDLVTPEKSTASFDPLFYVKSEEDVTHLAQILVNLDPKKEYSTKADPYWDEASVNLICSVLYLTLAIEQEPTLSKAIKYIKDMKITEIGQTISTNLDTLFKSIEQIKPNHVALSYWRSFSQLPPKTARCVYGSLIVAFNSVFTSELMEMMNKEKKLDFERFAQEKTVIFVLTSAVSSALHSFANMFFACAIKELFEIGEQQENGMLPIPAHILCDDFAVGGTITDFQNHISIFREKGISVSILLQSESQLASMYGENSATTIINNCDTYVYMGGMDLKTCEHISKRVNLPLEDVLYMPIGQIIVFRRGERPVITKRYDILNNKLYKKITESYEKDNKKGIKSKSSKTQHKNLKIEKIDTCEDDGIEEDIQALLESKFDELFGDAS